MRPGPAHPGWTGAAPRSGFTRRREVQRSVFASPGQEAFFEDHVHAPRVLGGLPRGRVRYGNLKATVVQVQGLSRARVEIDRWIAFRSHFGIESF